MSKPFLGFVAGMALTAVVIREAGRRSAKAAVSTPRPTATATSESRQARAGGQSRARFLARILRLVGECAGPAELAIAAAVAGLLAARTAADLFVIQAQTSLEAAIVAGRPKEFGKRIAAFMAAVVPISVLNAGLKLALSELRERVRDRLTRHLTSKWLRGRVFFLQGQDDRISGVDQILTADAASFSNSVVDLYSNVAKPALDLAVYGHYLGSSIGALPPLGMLLYLGVAGAGMTWVRRPMSAFVANQARLEGEFRHVSSRVVGSAERIAFMDGAERERALVDGAFALLSGHARAAGAFRAATTFVDSVTNKYGATAVGFSLLAMPFLPGPDGVRQIQALAGSDSPLSQQAVSTAYYSSGRMLLNMAQAAGRLVSAGRELTRLAGHTTRVSELLEVLDDLESGHYYRTMVAGSRISAMVVEAAEREAGGADGAADSGAARPGPGIARPATNGFATPASPLAAIPDEPLPLAKRARLRHVYGTLVVTPGRAPPPVRRAHSAAGDFAPPPRPAGAPDGPVIRFEACPVATPSGDVLLRELTMEVPPGTNVLVAGPNGSGKSSLFRVLAGLWPLFGGTMVRPPLDELVYVPQASFMPLGTLRECVTYPLSADEAARAGVSDDDVASVLRDVRLEALVEREGLDAVRAWDEILSGGERQRLSFARVFLRKPAYAIVDEATSQVSVDVEADLYERCASLGITLFSVSHRRSLWKFHRKILLLDGKGGYTFRPISDRELQAAASAPGGGGDEDDVGVFGS